MAGTCWLDISKFTEAWYEEDNVDQVGGDTDWTELLQDVVEDVAQVDGAKDRGEAEKKLKGNNAWVQLLSLISRSLLEPWQQI